MTKIVLVDDDENILRSLKRALARQKWTVLTFSNPEQALEELAFTEVDLVISDYRMPGMSGVEFLKAFKETHKDTIRLILSGQADLDGLMEAINEVEVYRFITKPWNDSELVMMIRQALEFNRLQQENRKLADIVRAQSKTLQTQLTELKRLESESPGITHIDWDEDGSIDLSNEYSDL